MSYTELFIVKTNGAVVPHAEYRNSWLGAALVWQQLFERHCQAYLAEKNTEQGWVQKNPLDDKDHAQIWALAHNPAISKAERIVLISTFDWVILERGHFQHFIDAVEQYAVNHQSGTLLQQAKTIAALQKRKIFGVCWNQTSVCSMWHGDNSHYYNINHPDARAWSLFRSFPDLLPEVPEPAAGL